MLVYEKDHGEMSYIFQKQNFIHYSAKDNMKNLRKAFNENKNITKPSVATLTQEEAQFDATYLKFVLEQGYSGYTYFPKAKFEQAFSNIMNRITTDLSTVSFMDMIGEELGFITDGHLSLTAGEHGIGFYKHLSTYVAELQITDQVVEITGEVELLPSSSGGRLCYLIGQRAYDEVVSINICIDGEMKNLPAHKIKSSCIKDDHLIEFEDIQGIAYVRCSTFIGDKASDLQLFYEIGKKCSAYKDVIWDLSNNLGGNSEFATQFIKGLNGTCISQDKIVQLQSSLVHGKETGEIKSVPYALITYKEPEQMKQGQYKGHLHIIINDRVASSGENAITMCACIQNKTVYGCNSLGIGKFGDVLIYYLPYSNITLWCPHKVFEHNIEETKGYSPDIWLDTCVPREEVINVIKREKVL